MVEEYEDLERSYGPREARRIWAQRGGRSPDDHLAAVRARALMERSFQGGRNEGYIPPGAGEPAARPAPASPDGSLSHEEASRKTCPEILALLVAAKDRGLNFTTGSTLYVRCERHGVGLTATLEQIGRGSYTVRFPDGTFYTWPGTGAP